MSIAIAVGSMAVRTSLDVDSLCQEYVSGGSAQEAPRQVAKGESYMSLVARRLGAVHV